MDAIVIGAIFTFVSSISLNVIQYILNKRSGDTDIAKKMAEAASILIEPYKKETLELRSRVEVLEAENEALRKENKLLKYNMKVR